MQHIYFEQWPIHSALEGEQRARYILGGIISISWSIQICVPNWSVMTFSLSCHQQLNKKWHAAKGRSSWLSFGTPVMRFCLENWLIGLYTDFPKKAWPAFPLDIPINRPEATWGYWVFYNWYDAFPAFSAISLSFCANWIKLTPFPCEITPFHIFACLSMSFFWHMNIVGSLLAAAPGVRSLFEVTAQSWLVWRRWKTLEPGHPWAASRHRDPKLRRKAGISGNDQLNSVVVGETMWKTMWN